MNPHLRCYASTCSFVGLGILTIKYIIEIIEHIIYIHLPVGLFTLFHEKHDHQFGVNPQFVTPKKSTLCLSMFFHGKSYWNHAQNISKSCSTWMFSCLTKSPFLLHPFVPPPHGPTPRVARRPSPCRSRSRRRGRSGGACGRRRGGHQGWPAAKDHQKYLQTMEHHVFPECVARVPVSLWGSGGRGVFAWCCPTVRGIALPLAVLRKYCESIAIWPCL